MWTERRRSFTTARDPGDARPDATATLLAVLRSCTNVAFAQTSRNCRLIVKVRNQLVDVMGPCKPAGEDGVHTMVAVVELEQWWQRLSPRQQRGFRQLRTNDRIPAELYPLMYGVFHARVSDVDLPAMPPLEIPPCLGALFATKRAASPSAGERSTATPSVPRPRRSEAVKAGAD